MRVTLVVAMARARVIGRDNGLPWHLSEDLKHFKALTLGRPVIMGRRTWESIGRALPGRTNIVITSNRALALPEGVVRAASLDEALAHGAEVARRDGVAECMVIGGAAVYREALGRATRIHLTEIDLDVDGDTWFPQLEPGDWIETARVEGVSAAAAAPRFRFITLERPAAR
jgi:dihydrofolate reductase